MLYCPHVVMIFYIATYCSVPQLPVKDRVVLGSQAFNSRAPAKNKEFLHTFYELGTYYVISETIPESCCTIYVIDGKISSYRGVFGAYGSMASFLLSVGINLHF